MNIKSVCKRGHDRTLPGAVIGNRTCRECHRLHAKKYHATDKGKAACRRAWKKYSASAKGEARDLRIEAKKAS